MPASPYYDPEVRVAIEAVDSLGTIDANTLADARAARHTLYESRQFSDKVTRVNVVAPGLPGQPEVRLRVHRRADTSGLQPCIFWIHGGGYILGHPLQDDDRFELWCQQHDVAGVSIDYRLAPEHPYPAALDDCYAGLDWVVRHGAAFGIDGAKVGIGGASAGAGLAAGLALRARDQGGPRIDYQLLLYPMIDDTRNTVSASWDVPIWNPASNAFGWGAYLGALAGGNTIPSYAAASRAVDLTGLPPTFLMVGSLDGFVDENLEFAKRLNHAGVPVDLHLYPGGPHGFDGFVPGTALAQRARKETGDWLASQLACRS
ncbi:MAG: alpha/beta hydrolase [Rhodoferax sp.]|nr:alpha/beta hydrolase [Rhodoferax sp.]